MRDAAAYNVRVIERAMCILGCFDDEHPERGLSEIAQMVNLPVPTVLRILATLQNAGYVERRIGSEKYRLGLTLLEMGMGVVRRLPVRRRARLFMLELERQFEETCDLSVFAGGELLCIEVVQSRRTLRVAGSPGYRSPLHATASGKAFLAHLPPEEARTMLRAPLQRYTERTITSPERLMEQLAEVRVRGYAVDDGEFRPEVRAVAAAICSRDGRPIAAMGVPGPCARLDDAHLREIGAALVAATHQVSLWLQGVEQEDPPSVV